LPLALGLYERRRSMGRLVLALASIGVNAWCIILTQSRSGQIGVMSALGVYFVRKFGKRGLIVAGIVGIPVILLGGRSGARADSSTDERLRCWNEALEMWRTMPLLGVGQGQFTEYHYLTAHNSFLLALAELGPMGLFLWTSLLYLAFKAMYRIQRDFVDRPEAATARTWAIALLAAMTGLFFSQAFLSVTYHVVVWTLLGLVAGLYGVVRRHAPEWRVRFGMRDMLLVGGFDVMLVIFLSVYLKLKGV